MEKGWVQSGMVGSLTHVANPFNNSLNISIK